MTISARSTRCSSSSPNKTSPPDSAAISSVAPANRVAMMMPWTILVQQAPRKPGMGKRVGQRFAHTTKPPVTTITTPGSTESRPPLTIPVPAAKD